MAFSNATLPTRLVICVDGTQYNDSGACKTSSSQTNVHRIYAGLKGGRCVCRSSGITFNQVLRYVPGIGSADDAFSKDRIQASVLGQGYLKQIQDVYESCCQLTGSQDEVWLFGFSRGAYVVRAVAGLLHHFGAVATAGQPEYARDFKKTLKEAERRQGRASGLALSPVSSITTAAFRPAPRIRFIGAFDTIKAVSDHAPFDITFSRSIEHMRHAMALHEDRKALAPEIIFPDDFYRTALKETRRSFVQAHFTGNHADMGGSAKKAGLGLYPLQWMLYEARACGLSVGVDSDSRAWSGNPLAVALPNPQIDGQCAGEWSCTTANGIAVTMHDLGEVHERGTLNKDYAIKLNTRSSSIRQKKTRDLFTDAGSLRGYCDWSPQGTIIHPSVYLLLDENTGVSLETKELKLQRHIEDWRERMLGSRNGVVNTGFWLGADADDDAELGAIRVLVCGNTGVGKSTLINKTFGVDVTQSSNRTRGLHDCREEITFEGRPDLIVHDSGGFEAGADDEYLAIEAFLKDKSAAEDVKDKLHVIWFCVDINSPRTLQTATEKLFRAVSQYASEVPIVVVATKKDDFLDIEFGTCRKALKKEGKRFDEEACEQYAEEKLRERVETIRSEMESVQGGRLDACLAVSQDDTESVAQLSKTTSQCFDTDKVRLLFVAAQVTRIDLKIDLALCEVMRRYKRLIRSATGSAFAPMGATINRKLSTTAVTKSVIKCFGLPTVSADTAIEALTTNVWKMLGANITIAFAESLHLIGILGSAALSGIPVWLITGAINTSYVVPATCRLFLIMACDLTFVLARSFKEVTFRASRQPNERDVSAAARNYRVRGYAQHVHRDIKRLVPRRNVLKSFKADEVQRGLEAMLMRYKDKLMEAVDLPLTVQGLKIGSDFDDDTSTEADSTLYSDVKEASSTLVELESHSPVAAELETDRPVVELPAESRASELADGSLVTKRHELEA
ncbi:hypothetical protein LTR36_001833 [Oleoguttula mirabilis]|uniref:Uncharacterized protein n=1 Tax=Oleoguttula mirabilis TaxID=1507867 RepID=A0AAV9JQ07_9PEZI|nr:hypothetical protein LTR36_001833 [Oleoguttula mirabilis]